MCEYSNFCKVFVKYDKTQHNTAHHNKTKANQKKTKKKDKIEYPLALNESMISFKYVIANTQARRHITHTATNTKWELRIHDYTNLETGIKWLNIYFFELNNTNNKIKSMDICYIFKIKDINGDIIHSLGVYTKYAFPKYTEYYVIPLKLLENEEIIIVECWLFVHRINDKPWIEDLSLFNCQMLERYVCFVLF